MSQLLNLTAVITSEAGYRVIWLALIALSAILVALLASVITWIAERPSVVDLPSTAVDGRRLAAAVRTAGIAFTGTIGLLIAIYLFVAS